MAQKILARLATKPTDARGYAAIELSGHNLDEIDAATGALHRAGLLNAFFMQRPLQPSYHPSSLTPEGRRVVEQAAAGHRRH